MQWSVAIIEERCYMLGVEANELIIKDYTEWRRTQSWYNDPDMDETLEHFKEMNAEILDKLPENIKRDVKDAKR
jgi:hypothetical protein